jgi:E2/UBC family protein E
VALDRRKRDIELVRKRYGQIEHGANLDWILIHRFPLPPGWNRRETELLVLVPPGYPTTPPDNFFVREGLRVADGSTPNNYTEGQSVLGGKWAQFSFHAQAWDPKADPEDGDGLATFLLAVEGRLREGR